MRRLWLLARRAVRPVPDDERRHEVRAGPTAPAQTPRFVEAVLLCLNIIITIGLINDCMEVIGGPLYGGVKVDITL